MQRHKEAQRARSRNKTANLRRRRLQLKNELYEVGVLKSISQLPSWGDPNGRVYIYFVNRGIYSLQDSNRKEVRWENVEFRKGYAAKNLEELASLVIGKILDRSQKEYLLGEV